MKTSARSPRPDSPNTTKFTYSQALAAGLSHSGWLTGPTNDPCGRDRALASHSVPPATARALTMRDTCGLLFAGYSPSADLQRSLASRLRLRLDANGSLEYSLTWKRWDIGQREPICALRALARRTSGKDCGGWLMGYPLFWTMIGFRAILKMKGQYDDYRKALLQSLEGC